jgi:hypothetical protein
LTIWSGYLTVDSMSDTIAPSAQIMQFLTAKWVSPTIGVLAELRVADALAGGPRTADELAKQVGAHPRSLYRLLRAAASVGVFAEDGSGRFELTPLAECLRSDVPGSMRGAAVFFNAEPMWAPYGRLRHSALTGEPAFDDLYGMDIYAYLAQNPAVEKVFLETTVAFYAASAPAIAAAYDFGRFGTVMDLGGGVGYLLASILDRSPDTRGVLFERPGVLALAKEVFAERGLSSRIELLEGDFFDFVPATADAYVIKSCLHNFRDDRALELLRVVRRATTTTTPLLVVDAVVPPGNEPHYSKFDDVEMLAIAGGIDRTRQEWDALLTAGGFELRQVVECGPMASLLEAWPVG